MHLHMTSLLLTLTIFQVTSSPAPQGTSSHATGCSDACYTAIATYDSSNNPYAGNGMCYSWMSHYPPAHTTVTYTGTEYLATVSPTTFSTRVETIWTMSGATASSSTASPTPTPTQARRGLARRQTTSTPAATSSVAGLPLPNTNIAASCANDPTAFASACSCIGDYAQTSPAYATRTISSTTTVNTITRECTSTVTAPACAATAAFGLRRNTMQFGDTGEASSAPSTLYSNDTTASACCNACFTSDQSCRFFSYVPPGGATELIDGGSCSLNLEGSTCPVNQLPPQPSQPYSYNYVTEGIYEDGADGSWYGFGPCAQGVPYFYGYENGRAGVGVCSAGTAVTTVSAA